MKCRWSGRERGGFSLIELIVSIGIVALLIGVLLPALGGAIGYAREIRCRANIRSLVTAVRMYHEDHDRLLPWAARRLQTLEHPQPFDALSGSLGVDLPAEPGAGESVERVEPFACPSDREWVIHAGFSYHYAPSVTMNMFSDGQWRPRSIPDWRSISSWHTDSPTELAIFRDADAFHLDQKGRRQQSPGDHRGMNFGSFDGSVRPGTRGEGD